MLNDSWALCDKTSHGHGDENISILATNNAIANTCCTSTTVGMLILVSLRDCLHQRTLLLGGDVEFAFFYQNEGQFEGKGSYCCCVAFQIHTLSDINMRNKV